MACEEACLVTGAAALAERIRTVIVCDLHLKQKDEDTGTSVYFFLTVEKISKYIQAKTMEQN